MSMTTWETKFGMEINPFTYSGHETQDLFNWDLNHPNWAKPRILTFPADADWVLFCYVWG